MRHYFALCQEGTSTLRERQDILVNLKKKSQKELKDMQMRIDCLSDKIAHYQNAIDSGGADDCNPLN